MDVVLSTLTSWLQTGIPIGDWVEGVVEYLEDTFASGFDAFTDGMLFVIEGFESLLFFFPFWLIVVAFGLLAWRLGGWRSAVFTVLGLLLIVNIGFWESFIATLTLVLISEVLIVLLGVPLGIWAALSDVVAGVLKPILDFMQTMPAFVYLIPAVSFFGLGLVPGMVATVIFALPPLIRLTNLGIRQVPEDLLEASEAFGSTARQKLFKVQLPLATPTIMAGLNQSIMLNLSMVVIAALIGAQGLGQDVIRGMNTLDIGLGFEAGLALVIMAIILDRITQRVGQGREKSD